ncbi:MAG: MFS transporter [Caulobacterales bacterium]|nr:MFS transporter [Caulobacterales bacterium]
MSSAVNITTLIDQSPISPLQWRVVGLCFLVAVIDGYDMQAMAFAAPAVSQAFDLEPTQMGGILSAALAGLMAGAFIFSPIADRIGRKPVIILACALMGVFSLLTVFASSQTEFLLWRFLTGLGLGAAMPSLNALTSEYAPAGRRAFLMTLMFVGVPIGNMLGGVFAAAAVGPWGWQSVFWVGAVAPLASIPLLWALLPESLQLQVRTGRMDAQTVRLASTIAGKDYASDQSFVVSDQGAPSRVRDLFSDGRSIGTGLVWGVFFVNLLLTFSFVSWMPSVLSLAGFPMERALAIAAAGGLGGMVGGLVIARLVDRYGFARVLVNVALLATLALLMAAPATASTPTAVIAVIVVGALLAGLQFGLNALAAQFYPPSVRSTGLGWALAVGRGGAIIGPIAMGALLARDWPLGAVFSMLAGFGVLSAVLLIAIARQMARPRQAGVLRSELS